MKPIGKTQKSYGPSHPDGRSAFSRRKQKYKAEKAAIERQPKKSARQAGRALIRREVDSGE